MKRTLEGTKRKRQKVSGFFARMATPGGRRTINRRRAKGRHVLVVQAKKRAQRNPARLRAKPERRPSEAPDEVKALKKQNRNEVKGDELLVFQEAKSLREQNSPCEALDGVTFSEEKKTK